MHEVWNSLLKTLSVSAKVDQAVIGEILARIRVAGSGVSQSDLSKGHRAPTQRANYAPLSAATVSKACRALREQEWIVRGAIEPSAARLAWPISLSDTRYLVGVAISTEDGCPAIAEAVLTDLSGARKAEVPPKVLRDLPWCEVAEHIAQLISSTVERAIDTHDPPRFAAQAGRGDSSIHASWDDSRGDLTQEPPSRFHGSRLLGIGITVGMPVNAGSVLDARDKSGAAAYDFDLSGAVLDELDARGFNAPVVIENDVNALAIRHLYSPPLHQAYKMPSDFAVIAVLDKGIGGALVEKGRLNRGHGGAFMEIGHLKVAPVSDGKKVPPFENECWCGGRDHLEQWSTPANIELALKAANPDFYGSRSLAAQGRTIDVAAERDAKIGEQKSPEANVFNAAGQALGQALGAVVAIADPQKLFLYLRPSLAADDKSHAGHEYQEAMQKYAIGPRRQRFTKADIVVERFKNLRFDLANAAALVVFDAFLEHARRQDFCETLNHDGE